MQLCVTDGPRIEDCRNIGRWLWGDAGTYAFDAFVRLNDQYFDGTLPPIPILIDITPYGHCIGATGRYDWLAAPRITLACGLFNHDGLRTVEDVLVHEMVHALLMLRGEDPAHNEDPWCREITRLSPIVANRAINAQPVNPRRVPNPEREYNGKAPKTIVKRVPLPGTMTRRELSRWPHSIRPAGYNNNDTCIDVPTY